MKYTTTTYELEQAIDNMDILIEERKNRAKKVCKARGIRITPEAFEVFMGPMLDRKAKLEQLKSLLEEFENEDFITKDLDETEMEINRLFLKDIY